MKELEEFPYFFDVKFRNRRILQDLIVCVTTLSMQKEDLPLQMFLCAHLRWGDLAIDCIRLHSYDLRCLGTLMSNHRFTRHQTNHQSYSNIQYVRLTSFGRFSKYCRFLLFALQLCRLDNRGSASSNLQCNSYGNSDYLRMVLVLQVNSN